MSKEKVLYPPGVKKTGIVVVPKPKKKKPKGPTIKKGDYHGKPLISKKPKWT